MRTGLGPSDIDRVLRRAAAADPDLQAHIPIPLTQVGEELVNSIICTSADYVAASHLFEQLRWGGQVLYVFSLPEEGARITSELTDSGFEITHPPSHVTRGFFGLPIPGLSRRIYYLVARKMALIMPGQNTDRFTFHVHLVAGKSRGYEVAKEVPTLEMVMGRLKNKWPDLANEVLEKRARKFSDKIFPVFLTREAAILKIVNRDLPEKYRNRVPQLLEMEKDDKGFAKRLHLSWLRNGGEPLSQMEFAFQSADLLRSLHDDVGIMHLDLRLDNFVITPAGVGFVDFGSAVRVDENLKQSPLLSNLFEELMRTSEIQRMLFKMTRTGEVTSEAISGGLHKVDKAVDCFYLAVQINSPHANPDLKDLIRFTKGSGEAKLLSGLTEQILRPADPTKPPFRSAADILKGIEQLRETRPDQDSSQAAQPEDSVKNRPASLT